MKTVIVHLFCLFLIGFSFTQTKVQSIQQKINEFCAHESLSMAAISFMAYDIDSSKLIAAHNPNMVIAPASVTKLFTTATAFEVLGESYRPKTELYYSGQIDSNGVLQGDIIIKGFGDPTLGSRFFYNNEEINLFLSDWVLSVQQKGIRHIKGKIIADGSSFDYNGVPNGWSWSDIGNYYGAGPSGCAVYDNMTTLHFSTSKNLNGPTKLDSMTPEIDNYILDNRIRTSNSNSDNAYIYGSPFTYERFAIGSLPKNKANFEVKVSTPDPELLLGQVFKDALETVGIIVNLPSEGMRTILQATNTPIDYKNLKSIITYKGKDIKEIAYWTNLRSVNFFAEQLLSLIGLEKVGSGETSKSVKYLNNYWESRLGIKMYQTDGSGLSRSNGFSANHFIKLLDYMYHSQNFEVFEYTLPIAGVSGTLRGVCRGQAAQGRLKAKSGTMNKIRSYAGYIDSKSGRKIAFAILVNNYDTTNPLLLRQMEPIFNAIAEL